MAVDGNMSAQHLKMYRPDLDIALTDGEGYVVGLSLSSAPGCGCRDSTGEPHSYFIRLL